MACFSKVGGLTLLGAAVSASASECAEAVNATRKAFTNGRCAAWGLDSLDLNMSKICGDPCKDAFDRLVQACKAAPDAPSYADSLTDWYSNSMCTDCNKVMISPEAKRTPRSCWQDIENICNVDVCFQMACKIRGACASDAPDYMKAINDKVGTCGKECPGEAGADNGAGGSHQGIWKVMAKEQSALLNIDERAATHLLTMAGMFALVLVQAWGVEFGKFLRPDRDSLLFNKSHKDLSVFHCGGAFMRLAVAYYAIFWFCAVSIPLAALSQGGVFCEGGMEWGYHTAVAAAILFGKELEIAIYAVTNARIGASVVTCRLGLSVLAHLDLYTDIVFVYVAAQCGSGWWIPSLVMLIIGVCCFQHLDFYLLYKEGALEPQGFREAIVASAVKFEILSALSPDEQVASGMALGSHLNLMTSSAQCCCEDLVQAVIQIAFLISQEQVNFQVAASVCVAVATSAARYASALANLKPEHMHKEGREMDTE